MVRIDDTVGFIAAVEEAQQRGYAVFEPSELRSVGLRLHIRRRQFDSVELSLIENATDRPCRLYLQVGDGTIKYWGGLPVGRYHDVPLLLSLLRQGQELHIRNYQPRVIRSR